MYLLEKKVFKSWNIRNNTIKKNKCFDYLETLNNNYINNTQQILFFNVFLFAC